MEAGGVPFCLRYREQNTRFRFFKNYRDSCLKMTVVALARSYGS